MAILGAPVPAMTGTGKVHPTRQLAQRSSLRQLPSNRVTSIADAGPKKCANPSSVSTGLGAPSGENVYPTLLSGQPLHLDDPCSSHKLLDVPVPHRKLAVEAPREQQAAPSAPTSSARMARWCFEQVAEGRGVDVGSLVQLRKLMSQALGVPEAAFGSMQRQHLRFNLDGSGSLNESELHRLMKMNLREYRKKTGNHSGVVIPKRSIESAGYHIMEKIGQGNQCQALLGRDRTGQRYCVKTFEKARMGSADVVGLKEEFEMLNMMAAHPSIPTVLDIFQDATFFYTVQAYYEGGDFTTLKRRAGHLISQQWWRGIFRQCFQGLAHLHENALMHCDIKESNLMLKKSNYHSPEVVIIDFGLLQTASSDMTMISGTPGYIPPEVWDAGTWYPGGDMFSMGIVVMQMLLDSVPPHHNPPQCEVLPGGIFTQGVNTLQEAAMMVKTREPPFDLMPGALAALTNITRRLLDKDVTRRPMAQHVLRDAWFANTADHVHQSSDALDAPFSNGLSEMFFGLFV